VVRIAEALKNNQPYNMDEDIRVLIAINKHEGIGPSTQSILNAQKEEAFLVKGLMIIR
jgi:hypothetical protein